MADSKYPAQFDTDVELPRVDDNITEIGGEAINGLRSAIFNIEETLGLNPQGTSADIATRLDTALNPDGSIKASALASIGLITLPITNSQVASNAGIEESKLDLDYTTVTLRTLIAELEVFIETVNNRVNQDIFNLNQHIAHPSAFGRHETQDIDGYTGKFLSYNLQGIITDIDDRLVDHVDTSKVGAHSGENISVDDSDVNITASNVQEAIEELDELQASLLIVHRDDLHSNGIVRTNEPYIDGYGRGPVRVASASTASAAAGAKFIQFSVVPSNISEVVRGDRIDVTISSKTYTFYVDTVNTGTGQVNFFGQLPVGGSGTAVIYERTDETFNPSSLILARRQDEVIQLVHPDAPFLLSNRVDPRKVTLTEQNIRITWYNGDINQTGDTGDIDVKDALDTFISTSPSTWTVENLAVALNEVFRAETTPSQNHFPLIAFSYKGELGIALDEGVSDGYLVAAAPSGDTAWGVLGFTEGNGAFATTPRKFYIDGYEFSSVRQKIETTAQASGNSLDSFPAGTDILGSGVKTGDLLRIRGSATPADTGSFIADSVSAASILVNEHPVFIIDTVTFKIYEDTFSLLSAPSSPSFYELFVDGYNGVKTRLQGALRATSSRTAGSTDDMEKVFDITDVSRGFRLSERRIYFDDSEGTLTLGQRGSGITLAADTEGPSVVLPTTNVRGHRFKLYDNDRINYVEIHISQSDYLTYVVDNALDLDVFDRISEERFLQVGVVLHNTDEFLHLSDRRLFGNVGRKDIRDDFTRDHVTYPQSILRGGGIIEGLSLVERNDGNIDAYGGIVFANGSLFPIETTEITIPTDGVATTYNLFVDGEGILRFLRDDQFITGIISTPSLEEIINSKDKTIIAQVDVNVANAITDIRDYRRFVGDIDSKLDLIVEENDITHGGFSSLRSAMNYLAAWDSLSGPSSRTVRVRGEMLEDVSDGAITVPDGVRILGDSTTNSTSSTPTKILLSGIGTTFLSVGDGVTIENVSFELDAGASISAAFINATAVDTLTVKDCVIDIDAAELVNSGTIDKLKIINSSIAGTITRMIDGTTVTDLEMRWCDIGVVSTQVFNVSDINSSVIESCRFNSVNVTDVIACSGSIDGLIIRDCIFTSTTAAEFLNVGSALDSFVMEHCFFDGVSGSSDLITAASITNAYINKNSFSSISALSLLDIGGTIDELTLTDNVFAYTSQSSSNILVDCNSMDNSNIRNNILTNGGTFIRTFNMLNDFICDNTLNDLAGSILDAQTAVTEIVVSGNTISDCGDYAIIIVGAERSFITNNVIIKSSAATTSTALIYILSSFYTKVVGNYVSTIHASSAPATSYMIRIAVDSESDMICDNTLINNSTSGLGILFGIGFDGSGASSGADAHFRDSVINNQVRYFEGATDAAGVAISAATEMTISNNRVTDCGTCARVVDSTYVDISNNIFKSISADETVEFIDLTYTVSSHLTFNNNVLSNSASAPGLLLSSGGNVFGFTRGDHFFISGNLFEYTNGSLTATNMVWVLADNSTVTNNHFRTADGLADHALVIGSPFNDASGTIVVYNNFRNVDSSGSPNGMIFLWQAAVGDNTDNMNWGQEYTISLGPECITADPDSASFRWTRPTLNWPHQATITGFENVYLVFTSKDVPVGSTIHQVSVGYENATGVATDLQFQWLETDRVIVDGSGSFISAQVNSVVGAGDKFVDLTPTGSDPVMQDTQMHFVEVEGDNGTSKYVMGLEITYTL